MKAAFLKHKTAWIIAGIVIIGGIVGTFLLSQSASEKAAADAPVLQTAKVRTGDLVVSSAGSGSVVSTAQTQLGFRTSGVVSAVNVSSGQQVSEGDILASLENSTQKVSFAQAEAKLDSLFSPSGIASYQLAFSDAQMAYDKALVESNGYSSSSDDENEIAILNASIITAKSTVKTAEDKYALYLYAPDDDLFKAKASSELANARIKLADLESQLDYYELKSEDLDKTKVTANLEVAKARLNEAETALEIVQSGNPSLLSQTLEATDGTPLAKLKLDYLAYENARVALENTDLVAPFAGVIGNLELVVGKSVNTNPVMTLTSMDKLLVKFYMDETDLSGLSVGKRTIYTFTAYPETSFEGEVAIIEPSLQTIEGSPVMVVWGTLHEQPSFDVFVGMTADVEIISGEAKNALIIPIQALRELAPESFTVFVVQPDGSLKLTPVTIGLRDFANAEVLTGLKAGDIVSTGTVETK